MKKNGFKVEIITLALIFTLSLLYDLYSIIGYSFMSRQFDHLPGVITLFLGIFLGALCHARRQNA